MRRRAAEATAARLLTQIRRDRRTVALMLVVPVALIGLLRLLLEHDPATFQRVGPPLVGLFPLISMFLITSVTMLRERTSGTLERLMTLPMARGDLIGGYAAAFALLAGIQAVVTATFALTVAGLDIAGSTAGVVALAVLNAILGMAMGLGLSVFATTEFQAVQFMPAFILPQLLLCGLFIPRATMSEGLRTLAGLLPMTYAYDALARVAGPHGVDAEALADTAIVAGWCVLALALGALTLRRRTP